MKPSARQDIPDVSAEQRASNDRTKLIRKLRWIGMENEARRLQNAPSLEPIGSIGFVLRETD